MRTGVAVPPNALDESAHDFVSTFMAHVESLTGYGKNRRTTIAGIKTLLLAAMAHGADPQSTAWRALHRAVDDLIDASFYAYDTRTAYGYLRAFVSENGDLRS